MRLHQHTRGGESLVSLHAILGFPLSFSPGSPPILRDIASADPPPPTHVPGGVPTPTPKKERPSATPSPKYDQPSPHPPLHYGRGGDPPYTIASMEGYISGCNPGDRHCHCQRKSVHLWQNESVYVVTFMHGYVCMSNTRDGGLFHDM